MMAHSASCASHSKAIKRLRPRLIRELPDPKDLLEAPELKGKFSGYEKGQILTPLSPPGRAEKLLDVLEPASEEVVDAFLGVLRRFKPALAVGVEDSIREVSTSPRSSANQVRPQHQQEQRPLDSGGGVEDAGVFGLNGFPEGPTQHLSCLSYTCREYLASKLNGDPPERQIFHQFCHALGVGNKLVQVSCRSRNPTGYLLQKYSEEPEATLERLGRALSEVGMSNVMNELIQMLESDGGGGGGGEDN